MNAPAEERGTARGCPAFVQRVQGGDTVRVLPWAARRIAAAATSHELVTGDSAGHRAAYLLAILLNRRPGGRKYPQERCVWRPGSRLFRLRSAEKLGVELRPLVLKRAKLRFACQPRVCVPVSLYKVDRVDLFLSIPQLQEDPSPCGPVAVRTGCPRPRLLLGSDGASATARGVERENKVCV